jgi:digeranylgeranylglycerophospholipid reductase
MNVDVLIIGLGPAGASTINKLSKFTDSNIEILGIDKRKKPGFPVQCGEFMPSPEEMALLMPDVPEAKKFFTFSSEFISTYTNKISFFSPKGRVIQTSFNGYTIHRGDWNSHLVEEAEKNGAEIWRSACAVSCKNNSVKISQNGERPIKVNFKVLIGADGVNSRVAEWVGLTEKRSPNNFAIVKQHLISGINSYEYDPTNVQMFFGEEYAPGAYAWIIPKNENTANVGAGVRAPMLRNQMNVSKALSNLINKHPIASNILHGAEIQQTIAGVVPVGLPFKNTVDVKKKTLLIGDASCQVVSSVGGGIPPSMVSSSIAANTIHNYFHKGESLLSYKFEGQKQMLKMFKQAYKIRRFFDKISIGKDSRIQWYMNRLSSSDIDNVVHCNVPWKLKLVYPFVSFLNWIIR